jgi:hypothetical protein
MQHEQCRDSTATQVVTTTDISSKVVTISANGDGKNILKRKELKAESRKCFISRNSPAKMARTPDKKLKKHVYTAANLKGLQNLFLGLPCMLNFCFPRIVDFCV